MPISIIRQDITKMRWMLLSMLRIPSSGWAAGYAGPIFKAAGAHELQAACDRLTPIHTGDAVVSPQVSSYPQNT